ncbi:hypothetical protein ACTQ49_08750 [Luteococcus sp. Sow4_B9]|uniref:hypothetical protein n=1 Tax=Luteococcus sp. Sow4_B9 TaxID=3438792 RepID=UPI003F9D3FE4
MTETTFSLLLAQAVAEHPATLEQISAELRSRGTPLSAATLSYWTTGRSRPARRKSRLAVQHLEEILGLEPGHLTSTLPGPTDSSWLPRVGVEDLAAVQEVTTRLGLDLGKHSEALSLIELVHLSAERGRMVRECRQLHRADDPQVESIVMLAPRPSDSATLLDVEALRSCRIGAVEIVDVAGVALVEVVLDRPLRRGELVQIEYRLAWQGPPGSIDRITRRVPTTVGQLIFAIHFEGKIPDAIEHRVVQDGTILRNSAVQPAQTVNVVARDVPWGLYEVLWHDTSGHGHASKGLS